MSTHEGSWAPGTPCWVDISVPDLPRSQGFYSAVLGWEFTEGTEEFGGYTTALANGRSAAGMAPPMPGPEAAPTFWTVNLGTSDSAATAAGLTAPGRQVMPPTSTRRHLGPLGHCAGPTRAASCPPRRVFPAMPGWALSTMPARSTPERAPIVWPIKSG